MFGKIAEVVFVAFIVAVYVCGWFMVVDGYLGTNDIVGANRYSGETWIDEVTLAQYMMDYSEGRFEVKDMAPNTALVEYSFRTHDNLPKLEGWVIESSDFSEVLIVRMVCIGAMVVLTIMPLLMWLSWNAQEARLVREDE